MERKVYRDFSHIQEHILNAKNNLMEGYNELPECKNCSKVIQRDRTGEICMDLDLAINMVQAAMKRERESTRRCDNGL